jgi:hypothetical protein
MSVFLLFELTTGHAGVPVLLLAYAARIRRGDSRCSVISHLQRVGPASAFVKVGEAFHSQC